MRRLIESLLEDLQNLIRLYEIIFVKLNSGFLFGHKALVISLAFWVTFAFDSSLGILLRLKSRFESYWKILLKYLHLIYAFNL